jgi:transcriptional regulator with XRE-family HTH domain
MSLSKGAGAALWAVRNLKKIAQADLGGAMSQKQVYLVEQGESSLTIGKMDEVCKSIGMRPSTFIALSEAARDGISAKDVLVNALVELHDFESMGGMDLLRDFLAGDTARAKQQDSQDKLEAVHARKKQGMTQAQIAAELGMAKSTVRYFWNKSTPK